MSTAASTTAATVFLYIPTDTYELSAVKGKRRETRRVKVNEKKGKVFFLKKKAKEEKK